MSTYVIMRDESKCMMPGSCTHEVVGEVKISVDEGPEISQGSVSFDACGCCIAKVLDTARVGWWDMSYLCEQKKETEK